MGTFLFICAGVALVLFFVHLQRSRELFCFSVRHGRLLLVRGRPSPSLTRDLADIAKLTKIRRATIRAVREESKARLVVTGEVDAGTVQRLRNVFGIHPSSAYRTTHQDLQQRNLGQILGIAWLAWLFSRN